MTHNELRHGSLKEALYSAITDSLTENALTRRSAEERIKAMEMTEDFGVYLAELSLDNKISIPFRQMSTLLLRKYLECYWISNGHLDRIEISFETRARIRKLLPNGLSEAHNKIRNGFAYCVALIGSTDWPDNWPNLLDEINIYLESTDISEVSGAIRVFEDLLHEIDNTKADVMVPLIIDQISLLLENEKKYGGQIRMDAIQVLTYIVGLYTNGRDEIKDALLDKLSRLCKLFVANLQYPDKIICDYGVKTNIIRFFTLLVQKLSKHFAPFLNVILPTVWCMVMNYGEIYTKTVVYAKLYLSNLETDEVFSGKMVGFTPLVLSIFDFIHTIVDCPRLNRILADVLHDIIYYVLIFMQITKTMEERWLSDPVVFMEDDSNDSYDTTVRVTARDVLFMITHDFEAELVIPALSHALNRHISEAVTSKQNGTCYWWKVHEVCMFALSLTKSLIINDYKSAIDRPLFDLVGYIEHWQNAVTIADYPLLLGRCISLGAIYSSIVDSSIVSNYLLTTLNFLRQNEPILRIFAIRAIISYCDNISDNPNERLFIQYLPNIFDGLLQNTMTSQNVKCLFVLSFTALRMVTSVDKEFAVSVIQRVLVLTVAVFLMQNTDPNVISEIKSIIRDYCEITECISLVQERFVPVLSNVLNNGNEKIAPGIQAVAMDVMQTIVKYSKPPLSQTLVLGFPAVVKCIIRSNDQMLLQCGGECLRCYLLLGSDQICTFTDMEGQNGLDYILQATTQLLDPLYSEEACKRVGRLIITLIDKAGPYLGSNIQIILRAILSKMQRVENMEVWQSLLVVFAYLFYTQLEAVLNFLTSIPGPTGVSALDFVLTEWLNRQAFFNGFYDRVVCIAALTKILQFTVTSDDHPFDNIIVRDELTIDSETKETGWTRIPMLGKAFKIIVNEMGYHLDPTSCAPRDPEQDSQTDESGDSDDYTITSDSDCINFHSDPDQHDTLYAQDAIFKIDILNELTDFLHKFKTVQRFSWFTNLLTYKEKQILASIGIFVN